MELDNDKLTFRFSSRDDERKKVKLILYREDDRPSSEDREPRGKTKKKSKAMERNSDLVGLWKNSEVLGSGEMSFATEYFMKHVKLTLISRLIRCIILSEGLVPTPERGVSWKEKKSSYSKLKKECLLMTMKPGPL